MAPLVPRRAVFAGLAAAALVSEARAEQSPGRVGMIDLELSRSALADRDFVKVRSMTLWATGVRSARKQSPAHGRGHADVMAGALADAFGRVAPGIGLELFIASPVSETASGEQVLDLDQLMFAYDWLAAQKVTVVVQTFVGKDTPQFRAAFEHARTRGLVIVTSAGNGPQENPVPAFPAAYGGGISVSTAALGGAFAREDQQLAAAGGSVASRRGYVDFAVSAPAISNMRATRDPDAAALLGSSRAAAVAGGLLAGLNAHVDFHGVDGARELLQQYARAETVPWASLGLLDVEDVAIRLGKKPAGSRGTWLK